MDTLKSTSILALILARNQYHIISIQGSMPMSHAQNTYEFEIDEEEHAEIIDILTSLKNLKLFTRMLNKPLTF